MNAIFVFPPIWTKKSPSTGITSISGYLKNFDYNTKIFDLNIDFYNEFLTDNNFNESYKFISALINKENLSEKEKRIISIFKEHEEEYNKAKDKVDLSVKQVKSKAYYDCEQYKTASGIIETASELISLAFYPYIIKDERIENVERKLCFEDYKAESSKYTNVFSSFMKRKAADIAKERPACVGISINFEGQMLAGLTLSYILKKEYNIKTVLGGTHITRSMENILRDFDFFDGFADFVMIGDGEIPTLRLLQYLDGKTDINNVPSIIYKKDNKIIQNKLLDEQISISFVQDFEYTKNKEYFLPEKVFPINISKGCYWGKCTFCDFGLQYTNKKLDKVISEIKYMKKNYGAKYFYLTDSALAPRTAKEFASMLIEEKLDIRWTTFLRFENVYDKEFLSYLYKAGLRCVSWGLESGSQKILNLMNKGTKIDVIKRILQDSSMLGIANRLTVIYLFPGETFADFCDTVNFIKENQKNIFQVTFYSYLLKRYSYIYNHMEEFGIKLTTSDIKSEYKPEEFGFKYDIKDYNKKLQEITPLIENIYKNPDETLLYFSNIEK